MDSWKFESHTGKQTALSLACIASGLALAAGFRDFDASVTSSTLAGFLLGLFLLSIGIAAFLKGGKQTIVVDTRMRRIVVEDVNQFGVKKRIIPFSDIVDTGIGYLGKKSNFVTFYYINLKLKNGEVYPLFSPGRFFEGGSDRTVIENRRQRIEESLRKV